MSEQTNIQALAVKYHNDVNSVSLQKFTSKELDILMTIEYITGFEAGQELLEYRAILVGNSATYCLLPDVLFIDTCCF